MIYTELVTYISNNTLINLETNTITKEEINAFISEHKLTYANKNERILVVLKNSIKLIGFFDAQES